MVQMRLYFPKQQPTPLPYAESVHTTLSDLARSSLDQSATLFIFYIQYVYISPKLNKPFSQLAKKAVGYYKLPSLQVLFL